MIISENNVALLREFQQLMSKTDILLNKDAREREEYYIKRSGIALETDVFEAVCECAKGTRFHNTIYLVSGSSFPDIVANKYYGIEVKSTKKNHWTSIGSSILESTRDQNVERIYLTFGKLGKPVEFKSKPYEECLAGIAVTHYPRYQIDMRLEKGETIFDKMGIPYDELRIMDNPVEPVSKYYKNQLGKGERLWWTGEEKILPPIIKLWKTLTEEEKEICIVHGYVLFPELLGSSKNKYERYALWLFAQKSVVDYSVRDTFSSGGQVPLQTNKGVTVMMPAAFGRINKYKAHIEEIIYETSEEELIDSWGVEKIHENRIEQWCYLLSSASDNNMALSVLAGIFKLKI